MSFDGYLGDSGTPKYSTATDIYDALQVMATGEEIGILSEMFSDISWDGQDYYYTDNAYKLVERWDSIIDCGDKMWLMDVAVWQLSDEDANQWILQVLSNDYIAKRIGFKKIFTDAVLQGDAGRYKTVAEDYLEELYECDRNDYYDNTHALANVLPGVHFELILRMYGNLCTAVYNKLKGLRLDNEKQLIAESRAMLTSYDDFMFGLKSNQALYEEQERAHQARLAALQSKYDAAVKCLLAAAQEQGVVLQLPEQMKLEES